MFGSTGEVDFAQNVAIGTQSGGSFGGGVGVLELLNASTQPSTALSGGCVLAAKAGALAVYDTSAAAANITINSYGFLSSANATSGGIGWTQSANTAASGTAVNMTLAAQSATGTGSTTGGNLILAAGTGSTEGNINLQTSGATTLQLNGGGFLYTSLVLGGLSNTPFQFNSASIGMGTGGTTTLTAANSAYPKLALSSSTLTSQAVLDFSTNAANYPGAVYFCDCTAINGGVALGTFGLAFKNGTTTQSLTALPTGGLVIVTISGTNKISIN
jgi:hypothetical protein